MALATDDTLALMLQQRDFHLAEAAKIDSALDVFRNIGRTASKTAALMGRVQERATGIPAVKPPTCRAFVDAHVQPYASPIVECRRLMALAESQGLRYQKGAVLLTLRSIRKGVPSRAQKAAARSGAPISARDYMRQHANLKAPSPVVEIDRLFTMATAAGLTFPRPAFSSAFFTVRKEQRTGLTTRERVAGGLIGRTVQPKHALSKGRRKRAQTASGDTVTNRLRRLLATVGETPMSREQIQEQAKIGELVQSSRVAQSTAKVLEHMAKTKEVKKTKDGWVAYKLQPPTTGTNGAQAEA